MESTCSKDCHLWKKYQDKCPNFVVGYWKSEATKEERRIEDCVPRRTLEMLKEMYNLLVGLHRTSNQERDASNALTYVMMEAVKKASEGRIFIHGLDTETPTISAPES